MPTTCFSNIVINPNVLSASFGGLSPISLMPPLQVMLNIIESYIVRSIFFIFPRNFLKEVKTHVGIFVLVLTSLFCYYETSRKQNGTGEKGYRSTLRLIYFEAFTLMSLTLSTQSKPEFNLQTLNFLLLFLVLAIIKTNFMVGLVVAVLFYLAMTRFSYSDSRRKQQYCTGEGEPDDVVAVVGETPENLSLLPHTIHSSTSLSILRRRPVSLDSSSSLNRESQKLVMICHEHCTNLEWLVFLNTPSPMMIRHVSFKTLSYVSLSATEYSSLLRSEWDFTRELPHLRLMTFWFPESRALISSNVLRFPQLMGPDDDEFI